MLTLRNCLKFPEKPSSWMTIHTSNFFYENGNPIFLAKSESTAPIAPCTGMTHSRKPHTGLRLTVRWRGNLKGLLQRRKKRPTKQKLLWQITPSLTPILLLFLPLISLILLLQSSKQLVRNRFHAWSILWNRCTFFRVLWRPVKWVVLLKYDSIQSRCASG